MGYDDVPALFYHAGDVDAGFSNGFKLVGYCLVLLIFDERITADGYNCYLSHLPFSS
jgi:hypothetical protein